MSNSRVTQNDISFSGEMEKHIANCHGTNVEKMSAFTRFVSRQNLSIFLSRYELFKKIQNVQGSIVECGVFRGAGLFTWAHLSSIFEPYNHKRRIIGFDSFSGFPEIHANDSSKIENQELKVSGLKYEYLNDLEESARLYDINRPLGHMPKIEFVKGDASITIPEFIKNNSHIVVALLYLDFDLYAPTKAALENIVSRMPKGAIIAFDELDDKRWPGETVAVQEVLGIRNLRIERFPFVPEVCYAVIE